MLPRRSLIAVLASGAALLSVVAAADAATVADYRVDASIDAQYHMTAAPPDGTAAINAAFTMTTMVEDVAFTDGAWQWTAGAGTTLLSNVQTMGHFTSKDVSDDCSGNTAFILDKTPDVLPGSAPAVVLSPFGGISWVWNCTASSVPSGLALVDVIDPATGAGPFDAVVAGPGNAAPETIVRPVSRTVQGKGCPLYSEYALSCTLTLTGTVTFTRTGVHEESAPPPPVVRQPVQEPPGEESETNVVDLIPGHIARDARRLHVKFRCETWRCFMIDVRVFAISDYKAVDSRSFDSLPRAVSTGSPRPLTRKRLSLAGGETKGLTVRFGRKARKLIKRAGGVHIVVSTTVRKGDPPVRDSYTIALPGRH